ncbi:MAG: hypothetical protein LBV68_08340 [Spirochaetaceae bacterium]|nr:hypothetical protein [Spirochaetaceae bacterium]
MLLIQICVVQDLTAQKVWKFGSDAEKMLWNRIVTRIEDTPGFATDHKYKLLLVGSLPALRKNYYSGHNASGGSAGLLIHSYDTGWVPFSGVEFYTYHFIGERYNTSNLFYNESVKNLVLEMAPEIEQAKVYPDRSSIVIKNDILLVVWDQASLDSTLEFIKNEN